MSEIISNHTMLAFQEYLVNNCSILQIKSLFDEAGIFISEHSFSKQLTSTQLVQNYYISLKLDNLSDLRRLFKLFEKILLSIQDRLEGFTRTRDDITIFNNLINTLKYEGFDFINDCIVFIYNDYEVDDLFKYQFPLGLPFGLQKPNFSVVSENSSQKISFEIVDGMALLEKNVYPNLTHKNLQSLLHFDKDYNIIRDGNLQEMCQTDKEKEFFILYAQKFNMIIENVPVLIPQAWIQWHSLSKQNLRSFNSIHADELCRLDFVAFWRNKRYAILIDDIGHYANKIKDTNNNIIWSANEENYSKRLKEDRKLRKENWEVFRISNWEIRNKNLLPEILTDLKEFIGF